MCTDVNHNHGVFVHNFATGHEAAVRQRAVFLEEHNIKEWRKPYSGHSVVEDASDFVFCDTRFKAWMCMVNRLWALQEAGMIAAYISVLPSLLRLSLYSLPEATRLPVGFSPVVQLPPHPPVRLFQIHFCPDL